MHSVECPAAAGASFFVYLLAHGYGWRLWRRRRYPAPTFENEEIQSLSKSLTLYSICWKRREKIKLMARSHSVVEKSQGNNKIKNCAVERTSEHVEWERVFFTLKSAIDLFAGIRLYSLFPSFSFSVMLAFFFFSFQYFDSALFSFSFFPDE